MGKTWKDQRDRERKRNREGGVPPKKGGTHRPEVPSEDPDDFGAWEWDEVLDEDDWYDATA